MNKFFLFLTLIVVFTACKREVSTLAVDCQEKRPVVVIHGFLASGDTYALQEQRFVQNGYCLGRIFAFDWNSTSTISGGSQAPIIADLDRFIDSVLTVTGATQVDLAGHSAGSGLGYNYLSTASRAAKVAHYAFLAGDGASITQAAGPNGEVPTLNIWSTDDTIVAGDSIPGAQNLLLTGKDHYQVATSEETFVAMFRFFNPDLSAPNAYLTPAPEANRVINISGRALSLGENAPAAGATIDIYSVNPNDGTRLAPYTSLYTITADANGKWGPVALSAAQTYEFRVQPIGDRPVIYYREALKRPSTMVYLRTLASSGLGSILTSGLPSNDDEGALGVFTASQATVYQRDILKVNNFNLSTPDFAATTKSAIASFLYDDNNNQVTDGTAAGLFTSFPFINGVDYYIPATPATTYNIVFNNRYLNVPNRRSLTDGVVVAVFD